jgi:hypothetical protein
MSKLPRNKWVLIGGLLGAGVLLYLWYRSRKSSTATNTELIGSAPYLGGTATSEEQAKENLAAEAQHGELALAEGNLKAEAAAREDQAKAEAAERERERSEAATKNESERAEGRESRAEAQAEAQAERGQKLAERQQAYEIGAHERREEYEQAHPPAVKAPAAAKAAAPAAKGVNAKKEKYETVTKNGKTFHYYPGRKGPTAYVAVAAQHGAAKAPAKRKQPAAHKAKPKAKAKAKR